MKVLESEKFLCSKRQNKRLRRSLKRKKKKIATRIESNLELLALHHFGDFEPSVAPKIREVIIKTPSVFSLVDATADTIRTLRQVANTAHRAGRVKIDWSSTETLDLGAFTLLKQVERQVKRAHILGNGSKTHFVHDPPISQEYSMNSETIFRHRFETRAEIDPTDTDVTRKEQATDKFCDHINKCLYPADLVLSDIGIQNLGSTVLEVLDNAEAHVRHRNWYVTGSIAIESNQNRCELVMYNFGRSIADSFRSLPDDHYANQQEVMPYVRKHTERRLRGKSRRLTEDNLITLAALQEKISSKNQYIENDRGQGTIDLIDFFVRNLDQVTRNTSTTGPRMAIISGKSHILFDGKYRLGLDKQSRKVIAFNAENELRRAPDAEYFADLGNRPFPGTAVCIKFYLKSGDVEERKTKSETKRAN